MMTSKTGITEMIKEEMGQEIENGYSIAIIEGKSEEDELNKGFTPISIWDYNVGLLNFIFELKHDTTYTKEHAEKIANYEVNKFGIFLIEDSLTFDSLVFGALTKQGCFTFIPKKRVKIKILKEETRKRLSKPIALNNKKNKKKAIKALVDMDKDYMITDEDYIDFSGAIDDIARKTNIEIKKDKPLFFDSIAYRIDEC